MIGIVYAEAAIVIAGAAAVFWLSGRAWASALVVLAGMLAAVAVGYLQLLSRPAPLESARAALEDSQILGALPQEGDALYLWLLPRAAVEPRYYAIPWGPETRRLAEAIVEAMREAEAGGTLAILGEDDDGEWLPHPPPQPTMPPKELTTTPPQPAPRYGT